MYSPYVFSEYKSEVVTSFAESSELSRMYRNNISSAFDDSRDIPACVVVINNGSTLSLFRVEFPSSAQVGRTPSVSSLSFEQDSAWVDRVIGFSKCVDSEDEALREISIATTKVKARSYRESMNVALHRFSQHDLPDIVCIAILRNTFSLRAELPQWYEFRGKVEQKFNDKNLNSKRLLRGLYA